jgi:citrate/tricarballylate utilization protein
MYTEPHDFAINIPALMAEARVTTYARYARPRLLAFLFEQGPRAMLLLTVVAIALFFLLFELISDSSLLGTTDGPESFYRVVDEKVMAMPALALSVLIVFLYLNVLVAFLRDSGGNGFGILSPSLWARSLREVATLRWLEGGGDDCYYPDLDRPSAGRRINHHILAYGFLITFASTVSAAFLQYIIGEMPPYPILSAPVILGSVGGIAVIYAATVFIYLNRRDAREVRIEETEAMDSNFLVALLLVSITGMALLVTQKLTGVVHWILLVHLATVLAFYILLPYGKMMHAVYRFGAILRNAQETREEERLRARTGS